MNLKATYLPQTVLALLSFIHAPVHGQNMNTTAIVNLVDGPNQDFKQGPGQVAHSAASGGGGGASALSSYLGLMRVLASSTNSFLTMPASAGSGFGTGFLINGNPDGVDVPLNFNFAFSGNFLSRTEPGELGSVSSVTASFEVNTTSGIRRGAFGLTTQAGFPVIEYTTGSFGSGNFSAVATPKVGIGVDIFELIPQDLDDLGLELQLETSWEEFEVSALKGVLLSAITAFGIPRLGIPPGTDVELGFDVGFIFESSVPINITVPRQGILLASLSVVASSSPLGATAVADLNDSFELKSVTVPHDFDAVDVEQLEVVLDSGEVFNVEREPDVCVPNETTLCLNQGRFRVEAEWGDFSGNTGSGQVVPFGSDDSGLFWFFSPNNWEMLVKVLDGCAFNDRFWVFAAATTDVEYTLRVTDTLTGESKTYVNPLGVSAAAITDPDALATCTAQSPAPTLPAVTGSGPPTARALGTDRVEGIPTKQGTCSPDSNRLCLNDSRFVVEVDWRDFEGNTGEAQVVPFGSDDSGLLWFFSSNNWEMLVKVLDGCELNDRFWVFSAATTNVEYTLRVTDTETDEVRAYFNPLGRSADAVTDTDAFATCRQ